MITQHDSAMGLDIAVVGIEFDGGTTGRSGAKEAPDYIRSSSYMSHAQHHSPYGAKRPIGSVKTGDIGNVPLSVGIGTEAMVTEAADYLYDNVIRYGARPLVLGGDHTVTVPVVKALAPIHGPLTVIHFDAHCDTWDEDGLLDHGTGFRRLIDDGNISRLITVGLRGFCHSADDKAWVSEHNVEWHMLIDEKEMPFVFGQIDGPVYLSIDIDVLDPSVAPGTGTPEPGGMGFMDLMNRVRIVADSYNIVGADIVEVCPAYDVAGITGMAANRLMYSIIDELEGKKK